MARENADTKSQRYLVEGRVMLRVVVDDRIEAVVRGEGAVWSCGWNPGGWWCNCPARSHRCSHLLALKRVCVVTVDKR